MIQGLDGMGRSHRLPFRAMPASPQALEPGHRARATWELVAAARAAHELVAAVRDRTGRAPLPAVSEAQAAERARESRLRIRCRLEGQWVRPSRKIAHGRTAPISALRLAPTSTANGMM